MLITHLMAFNIFQQFSIKLGEYQSSNSDRLIFHEKSSSLENFKKVQNDRDGF